MKTSESSESSGVEAGWLGVSREPGGNPKNVKSVSRNRSGDTVDCEDKEQTEPPMASRSAVQEREYRLRN